MIACILKRILVVLVGGIYLYYRTFANNFEIDLCFILLFIHTRLREVPVFGLGRLTFKLTMMLYAPLCPHYFDIIRMNLILVHNMRS